MREYYIGLISGTSMDGIDAVLADFSGDGLLLAATASYTYSPALRTRLRRAMEQPAATGVDEIGELDTMIGEHFRDAARALLRDTGIAAADIQAIGSHGQTIRHRPDAEHRFTMQLGDAAIIASGTGIDTVADFRSNDVALGGEGAPLVPPFHAWLLRDASGAAAVLNLGGIANLTLLPGDGAAVTGFDTGPANTLLDAWSRERRNLPYDENGAWAGTGTVDDALLDACLADSWFAQPPPKSTGFEYFNLDWLKPKLPAGIVDADVQATLAELTAASIADALRHWAPAIGKVYACGGGTHNADLLRRCTARLQPAVLESSTSIGVDPDWVEAAAFAWLARERIAGRAGNLPSVTGASRRTRLGAIYPA